MATAPQATDGGVRLVLYCDRDGDGTVPLLQWLDALPPRARAKVFVRLERLATRGVRHGRNDLRMLHSDLYELRTRHVGMGYYIYVFRHGLTSVVLVDGLTAAPKAERADAIEAALARKRTFEADASGHTFTPEPTA